jgi:hypothetical protein
MSLLESRLRAIGISPERIEALHLGRDTDKPTPTALAALAARLMAPAVQADVAAWRAYRDEPDCFVRMRRRIADGPAIERGRAIDQELPEPPTAAVKE